MKKAVESQHSFDAVTIWFYLRDLLVNADSDIVSGIYSFYYLLSHPKNRKNVRSSDEKSNISAKIPSRVRLHLGHLPFTVNSHSPFGGMEESKEMQDVLTPTLTIHPLVLCCKQVSLESYKIPCVYSPTETSRDPIVLNFPEKENEVPSENDSDFLKMRPVKSSSFPSIPTPSSSLQLSFPPPSKEKDTLSATLDEEIESILSSKDDLDHEIRGAGERGEEEGDDGGLDKSELGEGGGGDKKLEIDELSVFQKWKQEEEERKKNNGKCRFHILFRYFLFFLLLSLYFKVY